MMTSGSSKYVPSEAGLQAELESQLKQRIERLRKAVASYDAGGAGEDVVLAGLIAKLLDNRGKGGLLTRLNLRPERMPDLTLENVFNRDDQHGPACVSGVCVTGATGYVPLLDGFGHPHLPIDRTLPFDEWWNATLIRDAIGNELSRRSIVQTMRDKEEAHTDVSWPADYGAVAFEGTFAAEAENPDLVLGDPDILAVAVRQIAHEVLRAIDPAFPIAFCRTEGRPVVPIFLMQVVIEFPDGTQALLRDHKAWSIVTSSTADTGLAAAWQSGAAFTVPAWTEKPEYKTQWGDWKPVAARIVALNHSPQPVSVSNMQLSFIPV